MKLPRRQFMHLAAGTLALPALSSIACAQTYPVRPVRLVVGFAAGNSADLLARLIAHWLSERLGQPFVIDNRPGAGSNIASEAVVKAPADGYTLLSVGPPAAINATLYDKLNYNFMRDIAPVAGLMRVPNVIALNPAVPAKTVAEFIAYAKANPGKVNMSSGGNGTSSHVSGELFKMMAGVNMVHVPYRGAAPALTDLLGGQVHVMFPALAGAIEYIRAGRLRALAVTTLNRSEALPEIPTVDDFVPGYEASTWFGRRCAKAYAARDRRYSQSGDQRRTRRCQGEGTLGRIGRDGACALACRLRQARRRRNRKVGEGGQVFRRQGGLTGA